MIPTKIISKYSKNYPGIWKQMEHLHDMNHTTPDLNWSDWCYVPPEITSYAVKSTANEANHSSLDHVILVTESAYISVIASWRQSKEVFVFDKDLELLLAEQTVDCIPSEVFYKLPYPCIYIKLHNTVFKGKQIDGFFATLSCTAKGNNPTLNILFMTEDLDIFPTIYVITEETIEDHWKHCFKKFNVAESILVGSVVFEDEYQYLYNKALQMIVYLCCENAQISLSKKAKRLNGKIRDTLKEENQWTVGEEIGRKIRQFRQNFSEHEDADITSKSHNQHKSPVPHMRRGHYHHFWTGKRNDPASRKLVVHWIEPTFIAGNQTNHITEIHIKKSS